MEVKLIWFSFPIFRQLTNTAFTCNLLLWFWELSVVRSYRGLIHSKPINTFLFSITQAYHLLPYSLCTCTLDNQSKHLTFKFIYIWMHENWREKRALYSGQPEEGRWMNKNLNSYISGFGFYCTHARYTLSYVLPWNLAQLCKHIIEVCCLPLQNLV